MELREVTIQKREGTGKEVAKRLRRTGLIPGVLYGVRPAVPIAVNPKDLQQATHGHGGATQLLKLRFAEDGETRTAIIRDLQLDPVSEGMLHVDLQEVAMDRAITVTVPVYAVGEPEGVKEQSGILQLILREVQVSCLPGLIPERIDADVSALRIGDVLTIASLVTPPGIRLLNDPGQAVATVSPPMAEEVVAPAPAPAPAEPEVHTERKPKPEEEPK
ncbi:MAG: 50S ribosomal protein L25 [Candidatus Rokubacteria bacterium]|nr:50S ribosomal protein L25 [Candidatus Rokubacteria bacterium]